MATPLFRGQGPRKGHAPPRSPLPTGRGKIRRRLPVDHPGTRNAPRCACQPWRLPGPFGGGPLLAGSGRHPQVAPAGLPAIRQASCLTSADTENDEAWEAQVGAVNEGDAPSVAGGGELAAPAQEGRSRGSQLLWGVDRWTGNALTAVSVLAAGLAWVLLSVAFGFPNLWERVFQTLVAAVTLVMVFVIQHTQARHQAATQRKLDEILRVLPDANNALMALEHASDDELRATRHENQQIRRTALEKHADHAAR